MDDSEHPVDCWDGVYDEGLDEGAEPSLLDDKNLNNRLGKFTTDLDEELQVDRGTYKKELNRWKANNQRYKWRHRGPRHSRLIQLAFHDCLK